MKRDYTELKKKIRAKFTTMAEFACKLGITSSTLSTKLTGESDWKRAEIEKTQQILDLTPEEVLAIFF